MVWSDNYGFDSFALWNTDHIGSTPFLYDLADFTVKAFMGHAFLDAGIHLYNDLVASFVWMEQFSDLGFAFGTSGFAQKTACTRVVAF
jgi:hypothetical protein